MAFFSKFIRQQGYNLKAKDFVTETDSYEIESEWFSPEFLDDTPSQDVTQEKDSSVELVTSQAEIKLYKTKIKISFDPTEIQTDINVFVHGINQRLNWVNQNKTLVELGIIKDLLGLKNSTWLDEHEKELNEKTFIAKIKPNSINFNGDYSFELRYDDGELFGGHSILVIITSSQKISEAMIES